MVFSSQFALSLEITRLVPLALNMVGASADKALRFMRDVRNSGSDGLTEEDLALLFGRCRISDKFEAMFKERVRESKILPLAGEFSLRQGAGPTVGRALRQAPFFSSIVQLSLLAWTHQIDSLAMALALAYERRNYGATMSDGFPAPSQDDIGKVVRGIQEQSSGFEWTSLLRHVTSELQLGLEEIAQGLPSFLLGSIVEMFPAVQSLSEDRCIIVEGDQGLSCLVVWAHYVLGLTVLVKTNNETETRFGNGVENLVIDASKTEDQASVTLMDSTAGDILFRVQAADEDFAIDSSPTFTIRSVALVSLQEPCYHDAALIEEMKLIITSLTLIISEHLVASNKGKATLFRHNSKKRSILDAASLIFGLSEVQIGCLASYQASYAVGQPLEASPIPASLTALYHRFPEAAVEANLPIRWKKMLIGISRSIIILLLALSHVQQLERSLDIPFWSMTSLLDHHLYTELMTWDGKSNILVSENTWFDAFTLLLNKNRGNPESCFLNRMSLYSHRGWSMYVSTFGNADPSTIERDYISITHGVPVRNDIIKHGIVDAVDSGRMAILGAATFDPGSIVNINHPKGATRGRTFCSERGDLFEASIPLLWESAGNRSIMRTGYRQLHSALWVVSYTEACEHVPQAEQSMRLPAWNYCSNGHY